MQANLSPPRSVQTSPTSQTLTAFAGFDRIAQGGRFEVVQILKGTTVTEDKLVRVFDDATGERLELDLNEAIPATPPAAKAAEAAEPASTVRSVGRPKLGVVAREITLLPRHWEWLATQPGGASVALRKLVEEARRANEGRDAIRTSREAAYRFISEMAGDLPGFEEATRALFAGKRERFDEMVFPWPEDVRAHAAALAAPGWDQA
jgi:hypothetical protein